MTTLIGIFSIFVVLVTENGQETEPFRFEEGDHVAFVGNTFADYLREYGYFETLLTTRLPQHGLRFRNLAWSGDTLTVRARPFDFPSLDEELTAFETDVLIMCFGLGESFAGLEGLAKFEIDWQGLIDHAKSKKYNGYAPPRLVIVSPIACENLGELTPGHAVLRKNLQLYSQAMSKIASENDLSFVDLFEPTAKLMDESSSRKLTFNGIHLTQRGYWVVSQILADALSPVPEPWRVEIDAASNQTQASGTTVSDVDTTLGTVSFKVQDAVLPPSVSPLDDSWSGFAFGHHSRAPLRVAAKRLAATRRGARAIDMSTNPANLFSSRSPRTSIPHQPVLKVKNLGAGNYVLVIDGVAVSKGDERQWAQGMTIDRLPAEEATQELRSRINDKNILFLRRWRALNSVHIVGQRKSSPAGQALPEELKQIDGIIEQMDLEIQSMAMPASNQKWKLIRLAD